MQARYAAAFAFTTLACLASHAARADDAKTTETIVMVRHGEKPADGLGQLNCQGLNRSLALPRVIEAKFGRPDAIFAPDPARQKDDRGTKYDYVRPLATIEPTAIYFGMPVDASIGFKDIDKLVDTVLASRYKNELVVVAWEHSIVEEAARRIVKQYGGDPKSVPKWQSPDFDSIYIVRVTKQGSKTTAAFSIEQQGLNGESTVCPGH
ncbi:histidine phosphatase family protein [Caballeronia sp. BR00000012568055]|uniref:histidine phosphatase family protein n=1 Tax=Caballeronia sp. BR00000012568055 TaxID=2918761 RepID=UPI0023F738FF|nr:histidine phosphatase family protein [Caballeronia sp. BR00000012568055]